MKIGFYGGKFFPMHMGHLYCIDTAAQMCDEVIVILFINGCDELEVLKTKHDKELQVEERVKQVERVCSLYSNVIFKVVDVQDCKLENGEEDWDAETPLVRQYLPHMDYVFSSEPSYDAYFKSAYPEAKHILVDVKRKRYPISSTMIRAMKTMKDKKEWMV